MIAGPFGAQCLSDLGVDVVKVEPLTRRPRPGADAVRGQPPRQTRRWHSTSRTSPHVRSSTDCSSGATSCCTTCVLDPASRLGLDGPGLRASNPGSSFSHVSAYGPAGEMAALPGYDPTAQALRAGSTQRRRGQPARVASQLGFRCAGGAGERVRCRRCTVPARAHGLPGEAATSLLAVAITASSELVVDPETGQAEPDRGARPRSAWPVRDPPHLPLADGWIAVAALSEARADSVSRVVGSGRPDEILAVRDVPSTLAALDDAGVPSSLVRLDQLDAFHDNPMHHALGVSRRLQTPGFGQIDLVGGWWDFGPAPADESVPALGQHTDEVLRELGPRLRRDRSLLADGVIGVAEPRPQPHGLNKETHRVEGTGRRVRPSQ